MQYLHLFLQILLVWAAAGFGSSAPATEGQHAPQKLAVAFRCVSSQGFLRTTRNAKLGSILTATRFDRNQGISFVDTAEVMSELAWEILDALPGWVWIRHVASQRFAATTSPPEKPPWLATVTDLKPNAFTGLFRIERKASGKAWYLFSNHTGGYLNCIEGGLIRGHGYYPHNNEAATREPSTEFEVVALRNVHLVLSAVNDTSGGNPGHVRAHPAPSLRHPKPTPLEPSTSSRSNMNGVGVNGSGVESRAGGPPGNGRAGCRSVCKVAYDEGGGGYPTVSFSGALGDYVCPSMFRDMCDYVWKWPFTHFKEAATTVDPPLAAKCLPPVPVIYAHVGTQDALAQWARSMLRRPYIMVTGQSDWSVSRSKAVLGEPLLLKWFAQNADVTHPKLVQLPIGLNCFEHAPEMHQALQALRSAHSSGTAPSRPNLVLVNFGNTHSSRKKVWDHFCGKSSPHKRFATCSVKTQQNNARGNPHLVSYYKKV
jgi:hypothetical protein